MKILLTGIGGSVGSALARLFIGFGWQVHGVHRNDLSPEWRSFLQEHGVVLTRVDLAHGLQLLETVDLIVHTAAQSQPAGVPVQAYIRDNIIAGQKLLDFALASGVPKLVNLSSLSVYGTIDTACVDETTPIVNASPYGMSKRLVECGLADMSEQLTSVSLRLPGVLGIDRAECWLGQVLQKLRNNMDVSYFNGAGFFNNIIHVEDIAEFIRQWQKADHSGATIVNFACTNPMALFDILQVLHINMGSDSELVEAEAGQGSFVISTERLKRLFSYTPRSVWDIIDCY